MKSRIYGFPMIALCLVSAPVAAHGSSDSLSKAAETLLNVESYKDSCVYEVLLPSFSDPVTYRIGLESLRPTEYADTLAPCRYLIGWELDTPSGTRSEGFSAYFDGDMYRFRDKRLQEYHAAWDIAPFSPSGRTGAGVQNRTQFAELLPQFLGRHFSDMAADPSYTFTVAPDSVVDGVRSFVIDGVRRINGYDVAEFTYILDPSTYLPRRIEFENNPGQISEQSVDIRFMNHGAEASAITLDRLEAMSPDAFGLYRESSFALETLPGRPLPRVSAKTVVGERFLHRRGDAFGTPTLIAFLDTRVSTTPVVIADLREAVGQLPVAVDVVLAFLDKNPDDITAVVGAAPAAGELVLMNAGGMARECGAGNNVPVMLFCTAGGNVADVINGYNKDLRSLVIQKAMLTASE